MIKKYEDKPYEYPIEIELSSKCHFRCVGCIHKILPDRWYDLSLENFRKIIDFINLNKEHIVHVWLTGIGEPLLNKDILTILDELEKIKWIPVLLPTKWGKYLTEPILSKIQELRKKGIDINVQLCIYSMRKEVLNEMCWTDYYDDLFRSIKKMKSLTFDFTSELLLTKFTVNEIDYYKKFCTSIGIDPIIHRLHNFWWKLENYRDLYVEWDTEPYVDYNGICGFKPFFNWKWEVTPGTFCGQYNFWLMDKYNHVWWMVEIINDCYDVIDLKNEYCSKCNDNIMNANGPNK